MIDPEFVLSEEQHAHSENAYWTLPYNRQSDDAVAYLAYAAEEQPESRETLVFGRGCEETVPSVLAVRLYKNYDQDGEGWPEVKIPQAAIHEDSEVYKDGDSGMLILKKEWAREHNWFIDEDEEEDVE
jgi:hypothetical protein